MNSFIKVYAGHYIDLKNPNPVEIDIRTIAASLSKMCRYGCHCPKFYSVAEHCIHAVELAVRDGFMGDALRAVFLHDASEAYLGDIPAPLKKLLPYYSVLEHKMEDAIASRFKVNFLKWHPVIKGFDMEMRKAEKADMWPLDIEEWEGMKEVKERSVPFQYWTPEEGEAAFIAIAASLNLPF